MSISISVSISISIYASPTVCIIIHKLVEVKNGKNVRDCVIE